MNVCVLQYRKRKKQGREGEKNKVREVREMDRKGGNRKIKSMERQGVREIIHNIYIYLTK
jgi:hypothetical protein